MQAHHAAASMNVDDPVARRTLHPLILLIVVGALMTVTALATDAMLPAFHAMAGHFHVTEIDIQRVVSVFMLGYALPHLVVGSLADRFGRRPVLLTGLAIYLAGSLLAWRADSFGLFLVARFIQGTGASAGPILARTVLRDLYSGRELGRMLSFAMIFFGAAPLLAPTVGATLLAHGDWRLIFLFLVVVAVVLALVVLLVLPETLHHRDPQALRWQSLLLNAKIIFTHPASAWTVLILALGYGGLMGYIMSAPSLYMTYFQLDEAHFALVFALVASATFVVQPLNVRLLRSFTPEGIMRFAVPAFALCAAVMLLQALSGVLTLTSFVVNQMAFFMAFSLLLANGTTVALDPHQGRAGMASGLMGFAQLAVGTLIGSAIALFGDRGPIALAGGFLAVSLAIVLVAEVQRRAQRRARVQP